VRRSPARICVAIVVCLLWTAAPAAAQSEGGGGGASVDIRAVSAIAPVREDIGPRTMQVYRALIPDGYTLPTESRPSVGLWLAELSTVRSVEGRPMDDASHWIEGAVQLRVRHEGTKAEGWYPIHYPVTAEFWFNAGRYVGLPKRRASGQLVREGDGWTATATPRGTTGGPSMSLAWKPAAGQPEGALARAFEVPTEPLLVLNSALRGPDLEHVEYSLGPPSGPQSMIPGGAPPMTSTSKPDGGLVAVDIRPMLDALQEPDLPKIFPEGTDLSDLMVTRQTVPGTHAFFAVDLGSSNKKIGKGGYSGERPRIDPPRREGSPPRPRGRCASGRTVTMHFRAVRGARVRRIRAFVDGRRVRARRIGRSRKVRVRLGRSRAERRRVRVVVVQMRRSGERTRRTTVRTYRRCST